MIPNYTDINRGLKRKVNKAWREGVESVALNTQFLRDVSTALDELVKASKRGAIQEGTTWRIGEPKSKTHYDSIRNMSIDRLALFLADMCDGSNREYWIAWLQQEVDDADTR